jgi:hypothetical protein
VPAAEPGVRAGRGADGEGAGRRRRVGQTKHQATRATCRSPGSSARPRVGRSTTPA